MKVLEKIKKYHFYILATLIIGVAGFERFYQLGTIKSYIFDEVYYVKDAKHLWDFGYEKGFVVHPPFGKWMISIGMHLFNGTFGWRFMSAICGTLSVVLIILLTKRIFNNNIISLLSGAFLATDGINVSMSRVALLDIFVCFFGLLSVYLFTFIYYDSFNWAQRLDKGVLIRNKIKGAKDTAFETPSLPFRNNGHKKTFPLFKYKNTIIPLAIGVSLGLCISSKTIGAFLLFGLLVLLLTKKQYRSIVIVFSTTCFTYIITWLGWFISNKGSERYSYINNIFGDRNLISKFLTGFGSFIHYQIDMIKTATSITEKHNYGSRPYQWFFNIRPTQIFYEENNCFINGSMRACVKDIVVLNNPFLYIISLILILFLIFVLIINIINIFSNPNSVNNRTRPSKLLLMKYSMSQLLIILVPILAFYLPWFLFPKRTMFEFYIVAFSPFIASIIPMCINYINKKPLRILLYTFMGIVIIGISILYFPVFSGTSFPHTFWDKLMIFHIWI